MYVHCFLAAMMTGRYPTSRKTQGSSILRDNSRAIESVASRLSAQHIVVAPSERGRIVCTRWFRAVCIVNNSGFVICVCERVWKLICKISFSVFPLPLNPWILGMFLNFCLSGCAISCTGGCPLTCYACNIPTVRAKTVPFCAKGAPSTFHM